MHVRPAYTDHRDISSKENDAMLRSVDISDYMHTNPIRVHVDESLFRAMDTITRSHVSGACVVDDDDNLVGVLSEIDCLRAVVSATYNNAADVGKVRDFMTAEVQTCQLHDNIVDVAMDMIAKGHRRRPVIENGKLIGQLTCRRILQVVSAFKGGSP
jgi:CBS domain-containing protein